ncbi:hypothetical protein FOC56_07800 [Staphylococcus hominis]|uniref:hypothetical protein n=1 Tax=Staphylococcus hominis TaxID=1290 RepID=UPI0015887A09|nr:hypothetical protein [Staphylococcus hominis]QKW67586.1 hypothetical protein FOC56_07800 [Staphylococcus hominis]
MFYKSKWYDLKNTVLGMVKKLEDTKELDPNTKLDQINALEIVLSAMDDLDGRKDLEKLLIELGDYKKLNHFKNRKY